MRYLAVSRKIYFNTVFADGIFRVDRLAVLQRNGEFRLSASLFGIFRKLFKLVNR